MARYRTVPNGNIAGRDLAFLTHHLDGCTLTAAEAVRMASRWWDNTGRKILSKIFNKEIKDSFNPAPKGGGVAIKVKGSPEVVIPSRVLEGFAWGELDRREREVVVKAWLSQYRKVYAVGAQSVIVQ